MVTQTHGNWLVRFTSSPVEDDDSRYGAIHVRGIMEYNPENNMAYPLVIEHSELENHYV